MVAELWLESPVKSLERQGENSTVLMDRDKVVRAADADRLLPSILLYSNSLWVYNPAPTAFVSVSDPSPSFHVPCLSASPSASTLNLSVSASATALPAPLKLLRHSLYPSSGLCLNLCFCRYITRYIRSMPGWASKCTLQDY